MGASARFRYPEPKRAIRARLEYTIAIVSMYTAHIVESLDDYDTLTGFIWEMWV